MLPEYVPLLEQLYAIGGEFWSSCHFKGICGQKIITTVLNCLGEALLIIRKPCNSLTYEDIRTALDIFANCTNAGFDLSFLQECRKRLEDVATAWHKSSDSVLAALIAEEGKMRTKERELQSRLRDV